jgi:hypothetical protein
VVQAAAVLALNPAEHVALKGTHMPDVSDEPQKAQAACAAQAPQER